MFLKIKPVLHMVDFTTYLCSAAFLRSQSTPEFWKVIQGLWNLVYVGWPGHLTVNQGSNNVGKDMQNNLESAGVTLFEAPLENLGMIGAVESPHAPLGAAYLKIKM